MRPKSLRGENNLWRGCANRDAGHRLGPAVIKEAIRRTDSTLKRTDRRYEAALIGNIYDRRTEIFVAVSRRNSRLAEQFLTSGDHKSAAEYAKLARNAGNIAVNRYPEERMQALRLLEHER